MGVWRNNKNTNFDTNNIRNTQISIVVAMRNEAENILNLLNSISQLKYDKQSFELILVDDSSTDNSVEMVQKYIEKHIDSNILILKLPDNLGGKKNAIAMGIEQSKYNIIATTDADCLVPNNWLIEMAMAFDSNSNYRFLSMPILMESKDVFLQKFQQLDFMFLNALGGASMLIKKPLMCNAANMAFYKKDFLAYNNSNVSVSKLASGDDMFLMLFIKNKYPKQQACYFLKSNDALIITKPQSTFTQLVNQRMRWASKAKKFDDNYILKVGLLVVVYHFIYIALLLFSFINGRLLNTFFFVFLLKLSTEYNLYFASQKFYRISTSLFHFVVSSFLYPIFATIIAILSLFKKYSWKNRIVK